MYLSTLFNIVLASTTAMVSGLTASTTTNNEGGGLRRNLSGLGYSICLDEYACEAQAERDVSFTFTREIIPTTDVSPRMASTSGDMDVHTNNSLRLNLLESRHVSIVQNIRHVDSKF